MAYRVAATGEARFLVASRPVPELVEGDALVHANVTLLADEEEEEDDDDEVAFPLGPRGLNRGPLESCDDPNWMLGPPRRPHLLCFADDQPPRWGQIRRRLKWLFGAEAMRAVVADLGERPDARGAERKHMRPRPRRRPGERAGPPKSETRVLGRGGAAGSGRVLRLLAAGMISRRACLSTTETAARSWRCGRRGTAGSGSRSASAIGSTRRSGGASPTRSWVVWPSSCELFVTTYVFQDGSWRRRGYDADIPWGRVAAAPRKKQVLPV